MKSQVAEVCLYKPHSLYFPDPAVRVRVWCGCGVRVRFTCGQNFARTPNEIFSTSLTRRITKEIVDPPKAGYSHFIVIAQETKCKNLKNFFAAEQNCAHLLYSSAFSNVTERNLSNTHVRCCTSFFRVRVYVPLMY